MATALSRNSHFHRTLLRCTLHQWRSFFASSSPSPHLPSQLSSTLSPRPFPLFYTVTSRFQERICLGLYERFLCTAATSAAAGNGGAAVGGGGTSAESAEAKSSSGADSGDGGESQGSQKTGDAGKPIRGSPVSWMSFFLLLVTGAGIVFYYDKEKRRHIEEISNASNAVRQGPSVGQAAIGGPFNLINHEGKNMTDKDFLGKWTVMYFGFTHCPDICPDELQKLAAAVDKIKFHPKLIGLTGDPEEIRRVARAYRVYYMKTTEEGADYLVDHSIVMYLMSPEMKFVKFYGKNSDVDGLTNGIINEVKRYKK
uniref:Thioredoxin domain-containing protein n=1 Tax=Opuntia streptacantha TaxID=393608 RepID=A0A7C9B0Y5_OPUST